MAIGFYLDSALTQPVSGPLTVTHKSDGSTGPVVFQLWLGDPDGTAKYQADSNPGVDVISITPTDAAPGAGHEVNEIKLATTQNGLATATAGAGLDVGSTLLGGAVNAVGFWLSVEDLTGVVGTSTELGLTTNTLRKTVV